MEVVADHYESICYGCSTRDEMNYLLDVENEHEDGYLDYPGPFLDFPSSILEDLIDVLNDKRRLPKQMLHQIIQPQLKVSCPNTRPSPNDFRSFIVKVAYPKKMVESVPP